MHMHIVVYTRVNSEYCPKLIMLCVILEYLCALLNYELLSIILLLDEPLPTSDMHMCLVVLVNAV